MTRFLKTVTMITFISIVFLIVTLIKNDETELEIYSARMSHTYIYKSSLDRIIVPILINQPNNPMILEAFISNVSITSRDGNVKIPVSVERIVQDSKQTFKGETFYQYHIELSIGFYAEEDFIEIPHANLVIDYINQEQLTLDIGVFTYRFTQNQEPLLLVYDRINVHDKNPVLTNSFGMVFSLENQTNEPIELMHIGIQNPNVLPNMAFLRTINPLSSSFVTMGEILPDYDPLEPFKYHNQAIMLNPLEEVHYFVPFAYQDEINLLVHQYPLIITYRYDNIVYTLIADDFPFIRTNVFLDYDERIHIRGAYGKN